MNADQKGISGGWLNHLPKLFFNHMDAWGVTAVIVTTVLSIHHAISTRSLFLLLCITLTYWFGFALNDFFDMEHDRVDRQKGARNFFVVTAVSPTVALPLFGVTGLLLLLGFGTFGERGLLAFGVGIFVAWAYSSPPLRLKSRPGLDLLTHALFVQTFPYWLILFLLNLPLLPIDGVLLCALFFSSLSSQLEQQARDYAVDCQTDRNFTTWAGLSLNQSLMKGCSLMLIGVISFGLVAGIIPLIYLPFAFIMLPLLLHRFVRNGRPRAEGWVKGLTAVSLLYALVLLLIST